MNRCTALRARAASASAPAPRSLGASRRFVTFTPWSDIPTPRFRSSVLHTLQTPEGAQVPMRTPCPHPAHAPIQQTPRPKATALRRRSAPPETRHGSSSPRRPSPDAAPLKWSRARSLSRSSAAEPRVETESGARFEPKVLRPLQSTYKEPTRERPPRTRESCGTAPSAAQTGAVSRIRILVAQNVVPSSKNTCSRKLGRL